MPFWSRELRSKAKRLGSRKFDFSKNFRQSFIKQTFEFLILCELWFLRKHVGQTTGHHFGRYVLAMRPLNRTLYSLVVKRLPLHWVKPAQQQNARHDLQSTRKNLLEKQLNKTSSLSQLLILPGSKLRIRGAKHFFKMFCCLNNKRYVIFAFAVSNFFVTAQRYNAGTKPL